MAFLRVHIMSALPPKADIVWHRGNVRFVPKADILRCSKRTPLFDHLVGAGEQLWWNCDAQFLCRLEVDD